MKTTLNYKSRKTIIITAAILVLLALSATGIYVFTKGNDRTEAYTEGNTIVGGSQTGEDGTTNPDGETTVEPNEGSENSGEDTENTPNIILGGNLLCCISIGYPNRNRTAKATMPANPITPICLRKLF